MLLNIPGGDSLQLEDGQAVQLEDGTTAFIHTPKGKVKKKCSVSFSLSLKIMYGTSHGCGALSDLL